MKDNCDKSGVSSTIRPKLTPDNFGAFVLANIIACQKGADRLTEKLDATESPRLSPNAMRMLFKNRFIVSMLMDNGVDTFNQTTDRPMGSIQEDAAFVHYPVLASIMSGGDNGEENTEFVKGHESFRLPLGPNNMDGVKKILSKNGGSIETILAMIDGDNV